MMTSRWCPTCRDYRPEGHEVDHAPSLFDPIARDLPEGERRKAEGQAVVTSHTPEVWRTSFDAWVSTIPAGSEFTATDVLEGVGYPPTDVHPNTIGARLTALAKRGLIEPVGYRKSERPARHAGVLRVWRRTP